jgi:hypothetical protein
LFVFLVILRNEKKQQQRIVITKFVVTAMGLHMLLPQGPHNCKSSLKTLLFNACGVVSIF